MLVLALDTATPAVTAGVVELPASGPPAVRGVRVAHDARKHGELLVPGVLAACGDAGVALRDVDAVVVGAGPGPFTGLRVGMVTAAALGDALGVPVHGVCSLDAIGTEAIGSGAIGSGAIGSGAIGSGTGAGTLLVVTDARRREVYWAAYDASGARSAGPHVDAPAAVRSDAAAVGAVAAAGAAAHLLDLPVVGPAAPGPVGLVARAAAALRAGERPGPLEPLYLRRPDAVEPGPRKPVTTP